MTTDTATRAVAARRPCRILVLGPATESQGGVASVLATLLEGWPADGDHRPRHLATCVDGGKAGKLRAAALAALRLCGERVAGRVDLVHVHFAARASFYRKSLFILLARALGLPVVGHAHSGLFPAFYAAGGPVRRGYVRFVLSRLDRLVVLSQAWADFYRPLHRRSEPVVIPNPTVVPVARVPDARDGGPVLLSLGRLGAGKGTYDLLAALPAILDRHPAAELWLGGDGEVERVRALLADKPWGGRVRLLGWVTAADKDAALRAARVFVLPYHAEGLPMAVLEAMAYGLPVVATPVGGVPEAVVDGVTGVLVRPGDVAGIAAAVAGLLDAPERAVALGAAGRARALERYDVGRIRARLAALYDEVLEGG